MSATKGFYRVAFFCLIAGVAHGQTPVVTSVSPLPQNLSADPKTSIVATFDRALDPQTITRATMRVYGRWSGPAAGIFQVENNNTRVRFTPAKPFFAGEWVTVSLSKGLKSANGAALAPGYAWNFWIRTAAAGLDLQQVAQVPMKLPGEQQQVEAYGGYAGDLNADGWTDLSIVMEKANQLRIFLNDKKGGYGNFTIYPFPGGITPSTNEGADFNNDGLIDLAVGNGDRGNQVWVWPGNGSGGYLTPSSYRAGQAVTGLDVMDLDGDGDTDIVTANSQTNSLEGNVAILLNNGNGTFAPAVFIEANGKAEFACRAADANEDGIQDLFVGASISQEIILLLGDGKGGLNFSAKVDAKGRPWMMAVGDLNRDGHVDVVSANSVANNAVVVFGDGNGGLRPAVVVPTDSFGIAIDIGDIDGDGDLEMVTSQFAGNNFMVFENAGDGRFINPRRYPGQQSAACAILHDRDNDGDLDMSGFDEETDVLFLFRNDPRTSVETAAPPRGLELAQNYPNPFSPPGREALSPSSTAIRYALDRESRVSIKIYNLLGEAVRTLIEAQKPAGAHETVWDGRNEAGAIVPAGIYFYQIRTQDFTATRRLVFLR